MDSVAHRVANALVGNAPDAAALEIALLGPRLRFHHPCRIAICGADMRPELDDEPIPTWAAVPVRAGQTHRPACRDPERSSAGQIPGAADPGAATATARL
jgi:urea carboxylase